MTRPGVNAAVRAVGGRGANPGESSATAVTVNGSAPVSVTRTCTRPPTATSVRSRTTSAEMPGTGVTAGEEDAADEDTGEEDADPPEQAAQRTATTATAVRLMAPQRRAAGLPLVAGQTGHDVPGLHPDLQLLLRVRGGATTRLAVVQVDRR